MLTKPVYLDYAASTPIDPYVVEKMLYSLKQENALFANPASITHYYSRVAKQSIEEARALVAQLIKANPEEIIWTSGATESNNLAIKGVAEIQQKKGKHIISCLAEHKSVLDSCRYLAKQGFEITYLRPKLNGQIDIEDFLNAIRSDTILVSIMHVNNETGVIQPIEIIAQHCLANNILLHVDAVQSAARILIDLTKTPIDLLSLSAHKAYGPKGIGALYIRKRDKKIRLAPLLHGGGQEQGLRSGTLATHQIIGMGAAFAILHTELVREQILFEQFRMQLINGIQQIPEVYFNSDLANSVPNIINFSVANIDGFALFHALKGLALSMGSACTAASIQTSHVLAAQGVNDELAHSALRLSFGRFTTEQEIQQTITLLTQQIAWLRSFLPYQLGA